MFGSNQVFHSLPLIWSDYLSLQNCALELLQWFFRHIHKIEQTTVLFRLASILLFGLEIFTSFHTYPCLHGGALGVSALSWHLTNMRDGGRITTRVWNRSRLCAHNCQFGWVGDSPIYLWYSCPSSHTISFPYLSSIWITTDSVW